MKENFIAECDSLSQDAIDNGFTKLKIRGINMPETLDRPPTIVSTQAPPIDWYSLLQDNEIGEENGVKFVYMKGLNRLAQLRGIKSEKFPFVNVVMIQNDGRQYPFVQASYEITYEDGKTYSDVADAHIHNTDGIFRVYPSCIAANRAKCRAIRSSLGISLVSKEELGAPKDAVEQMVNKIKPEQKTLIGKLMDRKKIKDVSTVLKAIKVQDDVVDLGDLSFTQAQESIGWLNNYTEKEAK